MTSRFGPQPGAAAPLSEAIPTRLLLLCLLSIRGTHSLGRDNPQRPYSLAAQKGAPPRHPFPSLPCLAMYHLQRSSSSACARTARGRAAVAV